MHPCDEKEEAADGDVDEEAEDGDEEAAKGDVDEKTGMAEELVDETAIDEEVVEGLDDVFDSSGAVVGDFFTVDVAGEVADAQHDVAISNEDVDEALDATDTEEEALDATDTEEDVDETDDIDDVELGRALVNNCASLLLDELSLHMANSE